MKIPKLLIILIIGISNKIFCQSYTTFFTGSKTDIITNPTGGICLMGGASENESAMKWFLEKAKGGDVLVLRVSGADGYNDYFFTELGIPVNSVETIVFNDSTASNDNYIQEKIKHAEAIWLAGGDQWNYVSYWRNTPIASLINIGIKERNIVIGGTSAGMAVMGGFYFSARNDTVTSEEALGNPYHPSVTVDSAKFITNSILSDVITDTHYNNRDRKGRHIVFLARILTDYGIRAKGIACDEGIAVCIDTNGLAKVYGDYPKSENKAYFVQLNDKLSNILPESCSVNTALTWKLNRKTIKVFSAYGTAYGKNTFNLTDWKTGKGGTWENWYVNKGTLSIEKNL